MTKKQLQELKVEAAKMVDGWFAGSCKVRASEPGSPGDVAGKAGMPLFIKIDAGAKTNLARVYGRAVHEQPLADPSTPVALVKIDEGWLVTLGEDAFGSLLALMTAMAHGLGMVGIKAPGGMGKREVAQFFAECAVARFQIDSSPFVPERAVEDPLSGGVAIAAKVDPEKLEKLVAMANESATHVRKVAPTKDPSVN